MIRFPIPYDSDVWIRIPLTFDDERWEGAAEWAEWVADEAMRNREGGAEMRDKVQSYAAQLAEFDAPHSSARFWHFPVDRDPTGWVDVYVQERSADDTPSEDLLPDLPVTLADPVISSVEGTSYDSAARRLGLIPMTAEQFGAMGDDAGVLASGEWIGTSGDWVVLLTSGDHDIAALTDRLADIDRLFAGITAELLAQLGTEDVGSPAH